MHQLFSGHPRLQGRRNGDPQRVNEGGGGVEGVLRYILMYVSWGKGGDDSSRPLCGAGGESSQALRLASLDWPVTRALFPDPSLIASESCAMCKCA